MKEGKTATLPPRYAGDERRFSEGLEVVPSRRDYADEYRRRQRRARQLGFESEWQRRNAPRHPRSAADFARLPEGARQSRTNALSVLSRARLERKTIEAAAASAGISPDVVEYWASDALEPAGWGRTLPRSDDRLLRLRPLLFEGEDEVTFVAVSGRRAADRAHAVFDVQWRYANGQADESDLQEIDGVQIAGQSVEADPERLRYLAAAGALDPDDAYKALVA